MSQFLVRLRRPASDALGELSLLERRRHGDQAAVLLEAALLRWKAAQRGVSRRPARPGAPADTAPARPEATGGG